MEGRPFYQAVMSINGFKFLFNYRDHAARLHNDRLAAICEVWNKLVSNLRRFCVPEDTLTVDEQWGRYLTTYIPSKPCKYGVKIFWFREAKSGFPLNANIHIGKVINEVHRNLGKDVVL